MGALNWLVLLLTRPLEFKALLQFWLYYEKKRDIKAIQEHPTSGWDRESMRKCWDFLDKTSRSFAAVIKELEGDLARTVSVHPTPLFLSATAPTFALAHAQVQLVVATLSKHLTHILIDMPLLPRSPWPRHR